MRVCAHERAGVWCRGVLEGVEQRRELRQLPLLIGTVGGGHCLRDADDGDTVLLQPARGSAWSPASRSGRYRAVHRSGAWSAAVPWPTCRPGRDPPRPRSPGRIPEASSPSGRPRRGHTPAPARCRRQGRGRTCSRMAASSAFSGSSEVSKRSRLRRKVAESLGSALVRAAEMAAATLGTSGMSYQRWGLGSLPVTWRTWAALTTVGWPLSAPRREDIQPSYPAPFSMTTRAWASLAASVASVSKRWGSALGLVISEVTETALPPSCPAMSPQKFSAATTSTTPCDVEAPAGGGDGETALRVAIVPSVAAQKGDRGASTSWPHVARVDSAHNGNSNRNHFG